MPQPQAFLGFNQRLSPEKCHDAAISGAKLDSSENEIEELSHAVVIDGYQWMIGRYRRKYMLRGSNPIQYKYVNYSTNLAYVAINWGWKGTGDRDSSKNTRWYNISGTWIPKGSDNYTDFTYMIYDFKNE